ncbi:uncharacterized protein TNCT_682981 [Trichonephila clavata]|uniref:Noggin n=1 Tax=Trichonephila clavata TaxID=2740835 RepID=A0A8X6GBB6_TRICU|nr:uncharacterized protein TNCT_682981 [Trichonephila clavata]
MSSISYFRLFLLLYLCTELITSGAALELYNHEISYSKAVDPLYPLATELSELSTKPENQSKGERNPKKEKKAKKGKKEKKEKEKKEWKKTKNRRKHLDQSGFMELMGPDFKKVWMASDNPYKTNAYESVLDPHIPRKWEKNELVSEMNKMNLTQELMEFAPELLHQESQIRNYLLKRSSCPTVFTWFDLGSTFWPRWIRKGDCENREAYCSFPPGMHCVPNRSKTVLVLQWTCDDEQDRSSTNVVVNNPPWIETIIEYSEPGAAQVVVQGIEGKKDKRRNRDKKRRNKEKKRNKDKKKRIKDKKRRNKDKKRKNKDKKKEEKAIRRSRKRLPLHIWGPPKRTVPKIPKTRKKHRCSWIKVPYTITVDCFCNC